MNYEDPDRLLAELRREIDEVITENLQLKEEIYILRLEEKEIRRQLAMMRGA